MVDVPEPDLLVPDGIDVRTGTYLTPPLALVDVARSLKDDPGLAGATPALRRRRHDDEAHLGLAYGRDPQNLASAGWGVVVPPGLDPAVLDALAPLTGLRRDQAGDRFRVLHLGPGEGKEEFLARHGVGPSVVDPRRVPYYLLLLGSPEHISFELQYQLGVQYAVGRLDLPGPDAYASYAATVLASEREPSAVPGGPPPGPGDPLRTVHLLAPRHPGDLATALSVSHLVEPLGADLREMTSAWRVSTDVGAGATRARLYELLTSPDGPDVVLTAGHGLGDPGSGARELWGALVCQDWPGPSGTPGPLSDDVYLAAGHLSTGTPVRPRVVVAFACFGAGTPQLSDYPGADPGRRVELADSSFTAHLPQRLLSEPSGGALAFIGHVDRAWSTSFLWRGGSAQVTPFSSTVLAMMDGVRVGAAMESLTSRYAEVATELTNLLEGRRKYGRRIADADLVRWWAVTNDARGWILLGDPAVRVAPRGAARLTGA